MATWMGGTADRPARFFSGPDAFDEWLAKVGGKAPEGAAGPKSEPLLDFARYTTLAKRTDGYPVTYFNKADPDLFAKVIRQFQPQYQMSEIMAGIGTSNAASGTVSATHRRH